MAILSFANQMTADVAAGRNTKHARRLPLRVWTAAKRRLDLLSAATSPVDLLSPGLNLEHYKHHRPGYQGIRVNDQYRIIFRFEQGAFCDVSIEDYHGG